MSKLYLEELKAAMSSDIFSRLDTDKQEATSIKGKIESFISASKDTLTGNQYDSYRTQFETFGTTMEKRIALADSLSSAIKEALQLLIDYMGEDMYLDTAKLGEYTNSRDACAKSIERLNKMLNETKTVTYKGSDGKTYSKTENVYDSNEVRAQIAKAQEVLTELDRIIKKIQGLDAVYAQAESILNSAFSQIPSFGSVVTAIKPNGIYSYHATS